MIDMLEPQCEFIEKNGDKMTDIKTIEENMQKWKESKNSKQS